MTQINLYTADVQIAGTVYIKAASIEEAKKLFSELDVEVFLADQGQRVGRPVQRPPAAGHQLLAGRQPARHLARPGAAGARREPAGGSRMSRPPYNWFGTVPLKPGTTWQQIKHLWQEYFEPPTGPQLELEVEPTPRPDEAMGMPTYDWGEDDTDGVYFYFDGQTLQYRVEGDHSYDLADRLGAFLDELAVCMASAGWESREGDDDDQDEECMVWRGGSPRLIVLAKIEKAKRDIREAEERLHAAQQELVAAS